jgi:YaiO family outer membrane protein
LVALSFFSAAAEAADPPTIDPLLSVSQQQAAAQRFDLALQSLAEAAAMEPDNLEVKLQIARVHSWQGQYDRAEDELIDLAAADPDNADIRTALAYLDYYRGHNRQAAAEFSRILVTYPAYTDAVDGLKLAEEGQQVAAGFVWQFDAGFERSEFARQPTTPWNEEFAQITRFFDGGATALHARFDYYDEYKMANQYIEIGVDHRFAPWINAYLYGGYTIDATFRPRWRLEPGGNLRLVEEDTDTPAIWLTLDIKEDDYNPQVQIATIDPGLRLEYGDWAFSPNLVQVEQWGLTSIWGWNMRLDGPTGWEPLHFYVGYANAPETEDAITVYTASAYGGLVYNVDDAHALALAYTHDDRENSWIRHVVDLDFTDRF